MGYRFLIVIEMFDKQKNNKEGFLQVSLEISLLPRRTTLKRKRRRNRLKRKVVNLMVRRRRLSVMRKMRIAVKGVTSSKGKLTRKNLMKSLRKMRRI